ncbi:hypothetical protein GOP47_0015931 [Adiantum capillus-veneris]|uniref:Uncharacterized protein n=1 Tax=Adiantum capillus-veneris TaxID=13818 RepID=A0A9D4UKM2_ADICA|nr:hypothetical protein GOP47_0015931 [Adiantum capillus-veneris]
MGADGLGGRASQSTANGKKNHSKPSPVPRSLQIKNGAGRRGRKNKQQEANNRSWRQGQGQCKASPPAQDALQVARHPVRVQDIAPSGEYRFIPAIEDDLALLCLAYLPRSEHDKIKQINRKFCALITSGYLFKIRRRLGIAEQWIYMFSAGERVWQAYDPMSGKWSSLPAFASDYCFESSDKESFTVGTQLLVVGRHADDGLVIWRFDLVSNEWVRGSMMLTPRCLYAWASCGRYAYVAGGSTLEGCLLDGQFYVLGGENEVAGALTSCEVFDSVSKTWTLLPNMLPWADSRSFPGAPPLSAVVNNELYVLETESHQLKLFIKSTFSWRSLGEVPVRTDLVSGWGVAFKALGNYLLLIGGGRTPDYPDGMYVCRPDPDGDRLQWIFLSRVYISKTSQGVPN